MGERIVFIEGERIGAIDGRIRYFQSEYLERYRQNIRQIRERNAWKNEGAGAAFRGEGGSHQEAATEEDPAAAIRGVDILSDGRAVYTVGSADFSGIYLKPLADNLPESHVLHHGKLVFGAVSASPDGNEIAATVHSEGPECHITLVSLTGGSTRTLTEGDSVDDNPSWSRTSRRIYYNSAGIGRDMAGAYRGVGPSAICCLDLDRKVVEDVYAQAGHDCLLPREAPDGSIYFLRRPHSDTNGHGISFLDILMLPYKVLKGLFHFLEFFTHRYTGETFNTRGANPARSRQQDSRQLFIQGNLINVEKALKENQSRGETYPGIAPASWQLMRLTPAGQAEVVKKGVLDYDVAPNGDVVYSNGKFLVRLAKDGREERLEKVDLAVKVRVRNT